MNKALARRERTNRVRAALVARHISAVLCTRGPNVLMLSGFASVTGTSVVAASADGSIVLVVPEEEAALARNGWADEIMTFQPSSLREMHTERAALKAALAKALDLALPQAHRPAARIGFESGHGHLPACYASQATYGSMLAQLASEIAPASELVIADDLLARLRMRPTACELGRILIACNIAECAFREGAIRLAAGMSEREATLPFVEAYCRAIERHPEVTRADCFFYCMSGPNAAHAWAAFQQSGSRRLLAGEPVLIHCNSHADGYWTDLTRTYVIGDPDTRTMQIQQAILMAREAALLAIRPGTAAGAVDRAAREVLDDAGFSAAFRHPTGHGVGFVAIDHTEPPQLHPCSDEPLESGMVFNVEPGVYLDGYGGVRDCNMVAVTDDGYALLSPFQLQRGEWCIA